MIFAILGFNVVVVLVALRMARSESRENSMQIINAKWLADSAKFRLVSRWGIKD